MPAKKTTAKKKTAKATKKSTAKKRSSSRTGATGITAEERAAMKELAAERRAGKEDGEMLLQAKIAEMPPADRAMAKKVHAIVRAVAPSLESKTWYGMPAYAKDGKVLFFFQSADK